MRRTLAVLTLGVLVGCEAAAEAPNDTLAFLGDVSRCGIALLDIHPLHGGVEVHLDGSGVAIVRIVKRNEEKRFKFTPSPKDDPKGLLWYCVEVDLVTVKIKERAGLPDEARPRIILRNAEGKTHGLAKWANDKVPQFDKVYQELLAFRKQTEGLKPEYEGKHQRDWKPTPAIDSAKQPPTRTGKVVGIAVDEEGKPVSEAKVTVFSYDEPSRGAETRSRTDGRFEVEIEPGENLYVKAGTAGNWYGTKWRVAVKAGQETDVGKIVIREVPGHHPPSH